MQCISQMRSVTLQVVHTIMLLFIRKNNVSISVELECSNCVDWQARLLASTRIRQSNSIANTNVDISGEIMLKSQFVLLHFVSLIQVLLSRIGFLEIIYPKVIHIICIKSGNTTLFFKLFMIMYAKYSKFECDGNPIHDSYE